jgi:hypothetical protein
MYLHDPCHDGKSFHLVHSKYSTINPSRGLKEATSPLDLILPGQQLLARKNFLLLRLIERNRRRKI